MLERILLCLEGSLSGQRAQELGISLAKRLNATVLGLAIIDEPDIRAGVATGFMGSSYKKQRDDELVRDAETHTRAWLAEFSQRCAAAGINGRALEERGRPAKTVLDVMKNVELTLMGRHANFKFETAMSDPETRDAILHSAPTPVLVVPENAPVDSDKIVAAFDGSSASKRALRSFAESGLMTGDDRIDVVCVDDDGATAYELACRGVEILREAGVRANPANVVSALSIADAILTAAGKRNARLMVMGAYTRSRVSELLWGSVTREICDKTPIPLYLHH